MIIPLTKQDEKVVLFFFFIKAIERFVQTKRPGPVFNESVPPSLSSLCDTRISEIYNCLERSRTDKESVLHVNSNGTKQMNMAQLTKFKVILKSQNAIIF